MDVLTLKQALQETHGILAGINVPMALMQQIGVPILAAMNNLQECIGSIGDPAPAAEGQPTDEKEAEELAFGEGEI